jgi:hypothetical protein
LIKIFYFFIFLFFYFTVYLGKGICDFNKFVEIVFGTVNQIKKIILLGFEFPELHNKLNYLPVYLHTKRVKNKIKNNIKTLA